MSVGVRGRASGERRRALVACAHYYESPIQVGDHHIARGLVNEGFDVAFVSNPISPFHFMRARSPDTRARLGVYRSRGARHCDGRLWSFVPGCLLPPRNAPLLRSRWVQDHWQDFTLPSIVSSLRQRGFDSLDLLYVREPRQAFWLDALPVERSLYRIADRDSAFAARGSTAAHLERGLAGRVDLVAYTASTLSKEVGELAPKASLHLPNGVDFERFSQGSKVAPTEYRTISHPIAVYAGSIEPWFDFDLLARTARRMSDWSFVLVGPAELARRKLSGHANIHLLGTRPHAELPAYLHAADVGIIPFDAERCPELVEAIDPLKLYEYLACGLPVVARQWEELVRRRSPALLYRDAEGFESALRASLASGAERGDPVAWARAHDWGQRVSTLLAALGMS